MGGMDWIKQASVFLWQRSDEKFGSIKKNNLKGGRVGEMSYATGRQWWFEESLTSFSWSLIQLQVQVET